MRDSQSESLTLEEADIVQIDVLNRFSIVVSFSNGACARIESAKIKQLALSSPTEIFPPVEDSE